MQGVTNFNASCSYWFVLLLAGREHWATGCFASHFWLVELHGLFILPAQTHTWCIRTTEYASWHNMVYKECCVCKQVVCKGRWCMQVGCVRKLILWPIGNLRPNKGPPCWASRNQWFATLHYDGCAVWACLHVEWITNSAVIPVICAWQLARTKQLHVLLWHSCTW